MSSHREVIDAQCAIAEALAACQSAASESAWTPSAPSNDRLTCREVPQPLAWGSPVTVEITVIAARDGSTEITLSGSNFGLGPIQSRHVKSRVQALRQKIE